MEVQRIPENVISNETGKETNYEIKNECTLRVFELLFSPATG